MARPAEGPMARSAQGSVARSAARATPVRRPRWLVTLALAAVVLAGCSLATGVAHTVSRLNDAGLRDSSLNVTGGDVVVRFTADAAAAPEEVDAQVREAARIVWENLPLRVNSVEVFPRGVDASARGYSRGDLELAFGPRPAGLDRGARDIARSVAIGVGIGSLVLLAVVVAIIVLVVRSTRRQRAQPAGGYQGGWPPPGYPPPPGGWQQPGYPPPPGGWQPGYPGGAPQPGASPPPPDSEQPGQGTPPPPDAGAAAQAPGRGPVGPTPGEGPGPGEGPAPGEGGPPPPGEGPAVAWPEPDRQRRPGTPGPGEPGEGERTTPPS